MERSFDTGPCKAIKHTGFNTVCNSKNTEGFRLGTRGKYMMRDLQENEHEIQDGRDYNK